MTGSIGKHGTLAELADLLDAWGSDTARWPRAAAARLPELERLPGAAALIGEARALDRLLSSVADAPARLSGPKADALADRILAATGDKVQAPRGEVIAFPARPIAQQPSSVRPAATRAWPAAGLIAASLMLGIVIGGTFNVGPLVQELAEVAGLASVSDPSLGDDLGEEDTL